MQHLCPLRPVNPLGFLPDYSPYLTKLRGAFGAPPRPLPRGTPLLAPGQRPPSPVKRPVSVSPAKRKVEDRPGPSFDPSAARQLGYDLETCRPTEVRPAGGATAAGGSGGDWRRLLGEAARAYVDSSEASARPKKRNKLAVAQLNSALALAWSSKPSAGTAAVTPAVVELDSEDDEPIGAPRSAREQAAVIDLTTEDDDDDDATEIAEEAEASCEPPTAPAEDGEEDVFDEVGSSEDEDETRDTQSAGPAESTAEGGKRKKAGGQKKRKRPKRVGR